MDADQVLAFRLARSGLADRSGRGLAEAAACPASDYTRNAALVALAARADVTREGYRRAVDSGELVVAHVIRGAIHALAPGDHALYGRALLARDDEELGAQLGRQVRRLAADTRIAPTEALEEVAAATKDALKRGAKLDRTELHAELRARVREALLPWCRNCQSHHVAPMLWRYATIKAGARLDSERRYRRAKPGRTPAASHAVRRFLTFYGPATPGEFADWAGLATPHARRLWEQIEGDLAPARIGKRTAWVLRDDLAALESPPEATGIRLLPAGDPYLQKPNRALLAPDRELRKRLFRPLHSPGALLRDGRLAGTWRLEIKGRKAELTLEKLGRVARDDIEEEARRVAQLRGAADTTVVLG